MASDFNTYGYSLGALKPAQFWHDDPELWFAKIEAQFFNYNVKDELTKFHYTVEQLDKYYLTLIKDVVLSPNAHNKYDTLKSALLSRLKESKIKNIREILMAQDIGDKKPSEFLQHLKDLAGEEIEEQYIKSIWSSRLPAKVQWVTSFLTSSSLGKIAQLADLAINSPTMKAPENKSQPSKIETKALPKDVVGMEELSKRVEELTTKVESLSKSNKSEVQSTSNKITACYSTTKTASTMSLFNQASMYKTKNVLEPYVICWYHAQFGLTAAKCVQPCNFTNYWLVMP